MYDLQRASFFKRISAFLFDSIIFSIITVGLILIITTVTGYDGLVAEYEEHYDRYAAEYGIDGSMTKDEFNELTEEEKQKYWDTEAKIEEALRGDAEVRRIEQLLMNLTLLSVSVGLFLSFLLLEFAVPLFFRNGQTFGKKIFGVGVMRIDGVKVTPPLVFVRGILGKYTIEVMVPLFIILMILVGAMGIVGFAVLVMLVVFEIALVIRTKTNSMIHDAISQTVTVDLASQMIFESTEELIEYKKRIHAADAERAEYN